MPRQMPLVCMGLGFEVPVGWAVRREVWSKKKHTAVGNASLTPVGLRIWMTGNVLLGFVGKPKENCLTKVRLTRLCELSLSVKELKTGKRDQNRTKFTDKLPRLFKYVEGDIHSCLSTMISKRVWNYLGSGCPTPIPTPPFCWLIGISYPFNSEWVSASVYEQGNHCNRTLPWPSLWARKQL